MEEKLRFVFELESGEHTVTELCQQYEIARETGYVWLRRYRQFGVAGLMERSRAAHRRRNQTPEEIERWYTIYFAQFPIARFDSQELRVTPLPKTQGWYKGGEAGDMSPASPLARVERDQKVSGMCPV